MAVSTAQVAIIENRTVPFTWGSIGEDVFGRYLYNPIDKFEDFKFNSSKSSSQGKYHPKTLAAIEEVFNVPEIGSFIALQPVYDHRHHCCKIRTRMMFNQDFLKRLSNLFLEPVIFVQCKFSSDSQMFYKSSTELANKRPMDMIENKFKSFYNFRGLVLDKVTYTVFFEWKQIQLRKSRVNVLEKLFNNKTGADCCIITANGNEIKFHRFVFEESSDVLNAMVTNGLKESQTNRIEMEDLSDEAANLFLSYLYGVELGVPKLSDSLAFDLLRAAHKYNITSLEEDMLDKLVNKPDTNILTDLVLEMYFFAVKVDHFYALCDRTLNILRKSSNDLNSSPAYQDLLEKEPKEAAKLALKLLEMGADMEKREMGADEGKREMRNFAF